MKIIVDAFGGDNAPDEIVKGAVAALNEEAGFSVVLAGDEAKIKTLLAAETYPKERVEILHAPEVIDNNESPTEAVRKKKESSIVKAVQMTNSDPDAAAFVSAGSTGAVLTAAVLLMKRIKGVNRPALAPVLPTLPGGQVVLVDCGANADCKPLNLVQFAHMGAAYAKAYLGIQNPRVGLLSNGAEDKKGNALGQEVFPLLKEEAGIRFTGNLEARDILSGEYDVVVTDGFSGNIALKASEGSALMLFDLLKENIMAGGLRAKIGYLLLKPALKKVNKVMNYNDSGGAVLLGLVKPVVKSHGSSKAKSIKASVLQAKKLADAGVSDALKAVFGAE